MEKKTKPSPVEQMREWLIVNNKGADQYALMVEEKFNELFPEVQQLPIEGKVRIEGGELVIKDGIASITPLKIVPIQDIDALANASSRSVGDIPEHHGGHIRGYKAGYKQCLEDNKL